MLTRALLCRRSAAFAQGWVARNGGETGAFRAGTTTATLLARSIVSKDHFHAMNNPSGMRRWMSSSSAGASQSTMDLIRKLGEEIQEEEENAQEGMSEELKGALETSIFKVVSDVEDKHIVKLRAQTKDCIINVTFNVVDLMVELTPAEGEEGSGGGDGETLESTFIPVEIEITPLASNSTLKLKVVGKVTRSSDEEDPFMTPEKVVVMSPPADEYSPVIGELDAGLQDAISEWIADRNVDSDLFHLIMDYAIFKEGQTYLRWLKQFKTFVNAVDPSPSASKRR